MVQVKETVDGSSWADIQKPHQWDGFKDTSETGFILASLILFIIYLSDYLFIYLFFQ